MWSFLKGTKENEIIFDFFCRNWIHMVPRACNTWFLRIIFDSPEIWLLNISTYAQSAVKSFPRLLSQRLNYFLVWSGSDKIISSTLSRDLHVKTVKIFPLAEHTQKFIRRMLSVRWNRFLVCSVCNKIVSTYAQRAHAIIFEKYQIKIQILTKNLINRLGIHLIGPK